MVQVYRKTHEYPDPTPTPLLAFFLRYPNPFARHVLSVDVLSRHVNPTTGQIHTTRLILKRGILPKWATRWLPAASSGGRGLDAWILEESVVDPPGWGLTPEEMKRRSRSRTRAGKSRSLSPEGSSSSARRQAEPGGSSGTSYSSSSTHTEANVHSIQASSSSSKSTLDTPVAADIGLSNPAESTSVSPSHSSVDSGETVPAKGSESAQTTYQYDADPVLDRAYRTMPRLRVQQGNLNHRKLMHVIEGGEIRAGPNGTTLHHTTAEVRSHFGGAWSSMIRQRIESYGVGKFETNSEHSRKGMSLILNLLRTRHPLPETAEFEAYPPPPPGFNESWSDIPEAINRRSMALPKEGEGRAPRSFFLSAGSLAAWVRSRRERGRENGTGAGEDCDENGHRNRSENGVTSA
ncbi:hypothetical protein I317_06892 [Kwoniella heveanensis CBS 569]|nr:hypothetical protein I317_06892 [Kwoniella heveanensis CBS 569]